MKFSAQHNEHGFIMVWSLLLLIVVTLLGVAGISTSIFEERMAANEAIHKQTFYEADGGSENALALLIENINCVSGFGSPVGALETFGSESGIKIDGGIRVLENSINLWLTNNQTSDITMPTNDDRDAYYYRHDNLNPAVSDPHTNVKINGQTILMTGANLPMLAGYEGKGKALGSDGAFLQFDLKAEHIGTRNSRTGISAKFRLDNQFASYPAGSCNY